ncbi:hypothetical protein QTP88_007196 [Uroleucon formosanum]
MQAVDNNTGGLFFLDAPGGTGKTFVISLILATIRSRCDIALALASSGIAATLLDGGRTAHSALKLPLNLNTIDTPTCNISRSSAMGKLLMQCKLIVWDECTMAHKKSLEALNFTLKDLRRNNNIFGGLMILLAGDFRQTLPVVPRGTPADELNACLKASPLWNNVKTLSLTTNMRVQLQNDQSAAQFSKQLLDLGNGKVPVDAISGLITLTNDFCRFVDTQLVLIENVFPNISENYKNYAWLSQRAILAAKNNDVHALNFTIQSKIAGDLVTYKSVDSITNPDDVVNYPTEFLNSLEIPGFPPHNLQLKVGTVIMILRNLNPPRLCNGTRLSVKRLMPNLIEATIINGKYAGHSYLACDRDFGVIEKEKRYHHEIYVPNDWIKVIESARKKNPFKVIQMRQEDFKSTVLLEKDITNRKVNVDGEKVEWVKMQWLYFVKDKPYKMFFKYSNNEFVAFISVNFSKRLMAKPKQLEQLYPNGLAISNEKYNDLMELLQFILPIHHEFYKSLKKNNIVTFLKMYFFRLLLI